MSSHLSSFDERKLLLRLLSVVTLVFFLILLLSVGLFRAIPAWRMQKLSTALESGNTQQAARLLSHISRSPETEDLFLTYDWLQAQALLKSGDYSHAAERFAALGNFKNSANFFRQSRYQLALQYLQNDDYALAEEVFSSLGSYEDSQAQLNESRFLHAEALEAQGDLFSALELFCLLSSDARAVSRAQELAEQITGTQDVEAALQVASQLSPEAIEHRNSLLTKRSSLPTGMLDVGFYHTLACTTQGKALAAGSNEFGQCNVGSWDTIVSVAAGAYHSLGLKADGTVEATGRNYEAQCDVAEWTDIIAIAAADYASFGLRSDGTIVVTGFNDYYMLADWSDLSSISGGSYALAGLRSDGNGLISHATARSEKLTELVDLVVNTGYSVGLKADGTVVSSYYDLSDWTNVVQLSCSGTGILGVCADGSICSRFFRPGDTIDTAQIHNAILSASNSTHLAFVLEDGTVLALGSNDQGQCDTQSWKLF